MKLTIQGSAKEIAALVLAVQERREEGPILLDGLILKKAAEHILTPFPLDYTTHHRR